MINICTKWVATLAAAAVPVLWTALPASAATVPVGTVNVVNIASPFDSSNKTINTKCPAGTRVVGGGAQIAGGTGHVILTELRPSTGAGGDSYQVTAVEDQVGEGGTWSLLTYAYCASGALPGYEIVTNTSPVGSGAFNNTVSTCSAGKQSLGSGGKVNNGANQVDLETLGEGSSISNRSTAAALEDRDGFSGNWSVTAFTVCVKPSSVFDLAMVKVTSASDGSPTKTVVASCPAGKRATGGAGWSDTPGHVTSITPNSSTPFSVSVVARNTSGTAGNWGAIATVFCAS
jgi:hypothetical protein